MSCSLPHELRKAPLVESIFEFRFSSTREPLAEILVGLLYAGLPEDQTKLEPLPLANVPREIREKDANLRYLASHRLNYANNHISVGDHMLAFSQTIPYGGWAQFQDHVERMLRASLDTKLIQTIDRYSLKAVNIVPAQEGAQLSLLNGRFEVGGNPAPERGFRFRTELISEDLTTILEIITGANASLPNGEIRSGLLVQLDALRQSEAEGIRTDPGARLRQLHDSLKSTFFSLFTELTIRAFEPVWAN
jgi:uncharacterized protein (TIGR04255 family)